MGILGRAAQRQGEKLVAKHGDPGEQLVVRELVVDDDGVLRPGLREKDRRLGVIATDRALYFERAPSILLRMQYDQIAYVSQATDNPFGGRGLEVTGIDGRLIRMSFPAGDAGLGDYVREQVARLQPYEEHVLLGGQVEVSIAYTPPRPDVMGGWHLDGIEGVLRPDLERELIDSLKRAGDEVLNRREQGDVVVPQWEHAARPIERDWTEAVNALLAHKGFGRAAAWSVGDTLDRSGRSDEAVVVGVSDEVVFVASFESMRPLMLLPRTPQIQAEPLRRMADWEVGHENDGRAWMRLLVLSEAALTQPSLEDVLRSEKGFLLWLLGIADPKRAADVTDAVVERVKSFGAFAPGSRASHPLQEHLPE